MPRSLTDTIAAIATPPGRGAIGVLRLSGPEALEIAAHVWRGRDPRRMKGGHFSYGALVHPETGELIDRGLLLVFRAPKSYTGEDAVEFQLHGSPAVLRSGLEALLRAGARPAEPGEFTLRAYLNGRLDLAQAESVLALVEAETDLARRQALKGLDRALSERIHAIEAPLLDLLAHVQALLDYPEEGVEPARAGATLDQAIKALDQLLASEKSAELARKGARLVLLGPPNAGKSSLLNALLGYERAIVTPIPGTTRDYLEAPLEIGGIPIAAIDTAGLRKSEDPIEQAGVERALKLAEAADLVLFVADQSEEKPSAPPLDEARVLFVANKADLPPRWQDPRYLSVSARTGAGIEALKKAIAEKLVKHPSTDEVWLTSPRQAEALRRARAHLLEAKDAPEDLMALSIEAALEALAEVTGTRVQEDVIERIFKNFCVGK